jgi:hypothetical protein
MKKKTKSEHKDAKKSNPLTAEEKRMLDWCLSILEEEHILECQEEANEIATKEAFAENAYFDLLPILVKLRVNELKSAVIR